MAAPGTLALRSLDVAELAVLAGGPARAVDAALAALLESGRVEVLDTLALQVLDPRPRGPVEAAVLDAIGDGAVWSLPTVRWRALGDARLAAVAQRLADDGLLGPAGPLARLRGVRGEWAATALGRSALRRARAEAAAGPAGGGAAVAVALGGLAAVVDPQVRGLLLGADGRSRAERLRARRAGSAAAREGQWLAGGSGYTTAGGAGAFFAVGDGGGGGGGGDGGGGSC